MKIRSPASILDGPVLRHLLCFLIAHLFAAAPSLAQGPRPPTAEDYARAERFLPYNTQDLVLHTVDTPTWLPSGKFWYRTRTASGVEFLLVDPRRRTRNAVFDRQRLAQSLSTAAGTTYEAGRLPFQTFELSDDERSISFTIGAKRWQCDIGQYRCSERTSFNPDEVLSPDKKRAVFIRNDNLYVRDVAGSGETQLTTDGVKDFGYATDNESWRHTNRPIVLWSPDSKRIATFQSDHRGVGENYIVSTAPGHPKLEAWKYAMAGDETIPAVHRVIVDVDARRVIRLQMPPDVRRSSIGFGIAENETDLADAQWSADSSHLLFISTSRDYRRAQLRSADAATGAVREVMEESSQTFLRLRLGAANWRYLEGTHELLWCSSRDNWNHLYLHDGASGKIKRQITSGDWNVVSVLRVDERNRQIYFTGVGREAGRDPYFEHVYRVGFDGKDLALLTPEEAHHDVSMGASGEYFIDSYSKPDVPPVTVLRDSKGKVIQPLEKADMSPLSAAGWRPPVPITVKGRDGVTDLYGLMFKPSHFDASRKYPIVNGIYPGPQSSSVRTRTFTPSRGTEGDAQSLAEMGFIVVHIDGMGTPLRSKKFHETYYGNMGDNTLPDQITGMKQLAQRHPWIDIDRAGIYGLSGGGYATARALLAYPDFFKVGVAVNGNHDQRSNVDAWGEKWMGLLERKPDGTTNYDTQANASIAHRLKGRLLLVYSTMDSNVPPNSTLVLIDSLIRANKDFDVIVLPNQEHGPSGQARSYLARRRWDYFVRHLQGAEPPRQFQMRGPPAN